MSNIANFITTTAVAAVLAVAAPAASPANAASLVLPEQSVYVITPEAGAGAVIRKFVQCARSADCRNGMRRAANKRVRDLVEAAQNAAETAWVIIEQIGELLDPQTLPVDVTPDDVDRVRELMVRHGLDTPDALSALDALLSARR